MKHAIVARGILDHATVRSPLLPFGTPRAEEEIKAAICAAELSFVGSYHHADADMTDTPAFIP
ncbi:MAG: hypothetical protein ACR5LD_03455 [Symbiopectobacterium sp.]